MGVADVSHVALLDRDRSSLLAHTAAELLGGKTDSLLDASVNFGLRFQRGQSHLKLSVTMQTQQYCVSQIDESLSFEWVNLGFLGFIESIRDLESKSHGDFDLPEHVGSSSCSFVLTDCKNRLSVTENR